MSGLRCEIDRIATFGRPGLLGRGTTTYERARAKISDGAHAHAKLTSVVGRLMAETRKTKTYFDTIDITRASSD